MFGYMNFGVYKVFEDVSYVLEKLLLDVNEFDVYIIRCSGVKFRR